MKPVLHKGQLTTWKDDRGFGFIKPDHGGKEVFLHISALKGAGRRPKAGDTILYRLTTEASGKIRASNASIQGVKSRSPLALGSASSLANKPKKKRRVSLATLIGFGVMAAIAIFTMEFSGSHSPSPVTSLVKPGCKIKGNISITTGNKLYHIPGMEDYESTKIDSSHGEKWFCTEQEAIENGWRKAPR